jgi:serine/threonine-protein kinase
MCVDVSRLSVDKLSGIGLAHQTNYAWANLCPLLPEHYLSEIEGLARREDLVIELVENELQWRGRMPEGRRLEAPDVWRRLVRFRLPYARPHRPAAPDPVLFDRYRTVRPLGAGGHGAVDLMEDAHTESDVALKKLHPLFLTTESPHRAALQNQFEREARSMRQFLDLPVAQLLDFPFPPSTRPNPLPVLVMAFVPGPTLADYIAISGTPYSIPACVRVILSVAETLRHVHNRNLIHRDVKPSNIGFDARGRPILMDFGIARCRVPPPHVFTTSDSPVATAAYAPPEWLQGIDAESVQGEIYCLASTLYHLLTRQLPYPGATSVVALHLMKLAARPLPPSRIRDDVPASLDQLLFTTLSPLPEDRPQSMRIFAAGLRQILEEVESSDKFGVSTPALPELAPPGHDAAVGDPPPVPTLLPPGGDTPAVTGRGIPRFRLLLSLLAAALILLAGVFAAANLRGPKPRIQVNDEIATVAMDNYVAGLNPPAARATRFIRTDHRHNDPTVSDAELAELRQALREQLTVLSGRSLELIELPDSQGTIFATDLRQLSWKPAHWNLLLDHYPYRVYHGNVASNDRLKGASQDLKLRTGTEVSHLRGDWLVTALASPPLDSVFLKVAGLEKGTAWPAAAQQVARKYRNQVLTLEQMAREVGVNTAELRREIEAGKLGDVRLFQGAIQPGGSLSRGVWERRQGDLPPPFFRAIEACQTGQAVWSLSDP